MKSQQMFMIFISWDKKGLNYDNHRTECIIVN